MCSDGSLRGAQRGRAILTQGPRSLVRVLFGTGLGLLFLAISWWLLAGPSQAATRLSLITPPTVTGSVQVGQTLTERHGDWSLAPSWFEYQWEDCDTSGQMCKAITGASHQTYVVTASDLGHTLRVQETALTWAGVGDAISAATALVFNPPLPIAHGSSATSLMSLQSSAVTNQLVTLIATVTSSSIATPPSGTLTFDDRGAPIAGCQNKPVLAAGQSVTLTCQTTFATAIHQLTAAFTPSTGSPVGGSVSAPESLAVQPQPTTTSLTVSSRTVRARTATTYTAVVTPSYPGPIQPSQSVEFLDYGRPIPACASRPLTSTGAASIATCTVTYVHPHQHLITAHYAGDGSFASSTAAAAQLVDSVVGRIHPILSWTFYYNPHYTRILALMVDHAPKGATVLVSCAGKGCPFSTHALAVTGSARTADISPLFRSRRLKPGAEIVVSVRRSGWIGKRYTFKVRAAHPPRLGISCHASGIRPGVGC